MSIELAGEPLTGTIEVYANGYTAEIIIRCDSLSETQLVACNESCGSGALVTCISDGKSYVGKCAWICCVSCGTVCQLTSCTVS
jgi:hypothetical protein